MAVITYGCCATMQTPEVKIIYRDPPHIYKSIGCIESPMIEDPDRKSTATAFAVNKKYLITAGHFCEDVEDDEELSKELNLVVLNNNGEKVSAGHPKIIKHDAERDLCLLKLNKHGMVPLDIVKDYHKNVKQGDKIVIVGAPNGHFPIETNGKISMPFENQKITMGIPAHDGNSGSPVLNEANQVIGVAIQKDMEYHHVIFATPAHYLRKFLKKNKVIIE